MVDMSWLSSAFNSEPDPSLQKFMAPWEDSPGKGSRDIRIQDATGWGRENLGTYLQQNNGDPWNIFDADAVSSYLSKGTPAVAGVQGEGGWEGSPATGYGNFEGFTLPQLQAYLARQRSDYMNAGNRGNDTMWMPEYRDVNGKPMVSWGDQVSKKGGLWDKITAGEWTMFAPLAFAGAAGAFTGGLTGGAGAIEGATAAGAFGTAEEAAALGIGSQFGSNAGVASGVFSMPAAVAEPGVGINAFPGQVTASSGLNNAVTMGLPGTSGAATVGGAQFPGDVIGGAPVQDRSFGMADTATRAGTGNIPFNLENVPSALQNVFRKTVGSIPGLGGGGGTGFGTLKSGFDIGSGIYGFLQQQKQRKMAEQAFKVFQEQGMNAYDPVKELMANPNMVTGLPGYQFGLDQGRQAIQRRAAAAGGGGNEDIALARYTPEYAQRFYESEIARRMQLGQGQANLGLNSGQLGVGAMGGANDLASRSLASVGYGVSRMAGLDPMVANILKMLGYG